MNADAVTRLESLQNPQTALQEAVMHGNLDNIVQILPRGRNVLAPEKIVQYAGLVAMAGVQYGYDVITDLINSGVDSQLEIDALKAAFTSAVQFHVARDSEKEGVEHLKPYFERALARKGLASEADGYFCNQMQMLCYGAREYEEALDYSLRAIDKAPDEASYYFNAALNYKAMGQPKKALEYSEESLQVKGGNDDIDHQALAYELFKSSGNIQKSRDILARIRSSDPTRAKFIERLVS